MNPGEILFDGRQRWFAKVRIDGSVISNNSKGSIHSVGAEVQGLQHVMVGHFGILIIKDQ